MRGDVSAGSAAITISYICGNTMIIVPAQRVQIGDGILFSPDVRKCNPLFYYAQAAGSAGLQHVGG